MTSHPDDKINVDSMSFNDLRKELRKRQLKAVGKKPELQTRLKQYLAAAKRNREANSVAIPSVQKAENQSTQETNGKYESCNDAKEIDAVMEDAIDNGTTAENVASHSDKSAKKAPLENSKSDTSVPETPGVMKYAMKKQAPPKSALKPSKYTSSFSRSNSNVDEVKPTAKPVTSLMKEHVPAPKNAPTKISDSPIELPNSSAVVSNATTVSKPSQMSVQNTKMSSTLAQTTTPGRPFIKAKTGGASMKLLEKKKAHARANEERKKRMAEMRQKV